MRTIVLAGMLLLPASLFAGSIGKTTTLSDTQTLSFEPEGVIRLERSFGDVEIEGWDRPEVEITTIRSAYNLNLHADGSEPAKDFDEISVTAIKQGEDHLRITTEFPSRSFKRALRGKTDADLKYVIKAPAQAKIVVHHEIGEVKVINFTNDIEVTNRIGGIGLQLREPQAYDVDARVRIGDVSSDVGLSTASRLVGQQLRSEFAVGGSSMRRQLYLRVGIGEIKIQKLKW